MYIIYPSHAFTRSRLLIYIMFCINIYIVQCCIDYIENKSVYLSIDNCSRFGWNCMPKRNGSPVTEILLSYVYNSKEICVRERVKHVVFAFSVVSLLKIIIITRRINYKWHFRVEYKLKHFKLCACRYCLNDIFFQFMLPCRFDK